MEEKDQQAGQAANNNDVGEQKIETGSHHSHPSHLSHHDQENGKLQLNKVGIEVPSQAVETKSKVGKNLKGKSHIGDQSQNDNDQDKKDMQAIFDGDDIKSPFPKLEAILDNNYFQVFVTVMTIYALFGDDIRVIAFTKSADIYFDVVTISAMTTFILEMVLAMLSKISYSCSFYFWLDMISTVSLITDIQMVNNELFYSSGGSQKQLAQAGKASRVGTKAGRVVRLVRLIRIVKLYKATQDAKEKRLNTAKLKYAERKKKKKQKIHPQQEEAPEQKEEKGFCPCLKKNKALQKEKQKEKLELEKQVELNMKKEKERKELLTKQLQQKQGSTVDKRRASRMVQQQSRLSQAAIQDIQKKQEVQEKRVKEIQKESRVSQVLSARTTKRVIIIVLAMLFIIPLFSAEYFFDPPASIKFSMKIMQQWAEYSGSTQAELQELFDVIKETHEQGQTRSYLAYIKTPFEGMYYEMDNYDELREDEKEQGGYTLDVDKYAAAHPNETAIIERLRNPPADDDTFLDFSGVLSIRETSIFTAALSLGRTVFVCFVLTCGALYFSKDANDLALGPIERMIVKLTRISRNPISAKDEVQMQDNADENETKKIENAIVQISNLLALGFGEAGSKIIGNNISSQGGDVDPIIPGYKLFAIYGFVDIRNFTDTTEVLQEDIMVFVNNIGEIVHSYCDRYQGAGNKNIGDAFLLVWRIQEDKYELMESNNVYFKDSKYITILCDMAVMCFMRIYSKLHREMKFLKYREDPKLLELMPEFRIKTGFGLHMGWGVEGAIGSEFKIDASYLSPNVHLSERLVDATKIYGVPILISQSVQEKCSFQLKRYLRNVDRVSVWEDQEPLNIFTVDMDVENLPVSKDPAVYLDDPEDRKETLQFKKYIKQIQVNYWEGETEQEDIYEPWDAEQEIQEKKDLKHMFETWDEFFQNLFTEGFQQYISGNWKAAINKFKYIERSEYQGDGPTQALLKFMEEQDWKCPEDWAGYRKFLC